MSGCDLCPFKRSEEFQRVIPGGGEKGGICIVGESNGFDEARANAPFVGKSGRLLHNTLDQLGLTKVYFTNVCPCWPGYHFTPKKEHILACRSRLIEEIKAVDPLITVACGASALEALAPGQKVMKVRGRVLETEVGKVIATPHPAAVLRSPEQYKDLVRDLDLINRVLNPVPLTPPETVVIENTGGMFRMLREVPTPEHCTHAACDIETSSLDETDYEHGDIVCVGICFDAKKVYVITQNALRESFVRRQLKMLLEAPYVWVGQNAPQFDAKWLKERLDINFDSSFDTMLAHYTLDERERGHGLKALAAEYFGADDYAAEVRQNEYWNDPSSTARAALYEYQALDCYYTWLLKDALEQEMIREGVKDLHDRILLPGAKVLSDIERTGICVDVDFLEKVRTEYADRKAYLLDGLREIAQKPTFNPSSPKQVQALLSSTLGVLPEGYGTAEEILNQIKGNHPAVQMVLDYRECVKMIGTYIDAMIARINPHDHRIHCDFKITGTRTGRLSSASPNLQNIPPLMRNAFTAEPGWRLVEVDGSQLELRVLALVTGDANLIAAYREGRDIHREVASVMFKIPVEEVTDKQRKQAKFTDFGVIYGRGAEAIAREYQIAVEEAQRFIDRFLGRYPGVRRWVEAQHRFAREHHYVKSLFGRKRRFPCIVASNADDVDRQAVNTPIQGDASDLCFTALQRIHRRFSPERQRILLTVHDSILVEYRPEYEEETIRMMVEEWEHNCPLESPVPILVEGKVGERWGSLQEIDLDPYRWWKTGQPATET